MSFVFAHSDFSEDKLDRAFELYYVDIKAAVRHCGHSSAASTEIVHDLYVKLSQQSGLLQRDFLSLSLCSAAMYLGFKRLGIKPAAELIAGMDLIQVLEDQNIIATSPQDTSVSFLNKCVGFFRIPRKVMAPVLPCVFSSTKNFR